MYAVANIDSSLWGTRSIGDVKTSATDPNTTKTQTVADLEEAVPVTSSPTGGNDGTDGSKKGLATFCRVHTGAALATSTVATVDGEGGVPPMRDGSEGAASSTGTLATDSSDPDDDGTTDETGTEQGPGGKEGLGGDKERGKLSLRAWKFILLALWVLINVGLTLSLLYGRLLVVGSLFFFSQVHAQVFFVVAAWLEMRLQRRSALPPQPPCANVLAEGSINNCKR